MLSSQADGFSQRHQYQLTRHELLPRQLLVLMDFTSVYLSPKGGDNVYIQDCIVVLEWIEYDPITRNNRRQRLNLDYLCGHADTNKNDYHFVLHVWLKVFMDYRLNERFNCISIWSDGGPKHFKTRYCQWMWHYLSMYNFNMKPICHNFFGSYHGHSLADGHAASIKRVLHTEYHTSALQRLTPSTVALYWGPSTCDHYKELIERACNATKVHIFPSIDRDPLLRPAIHAIDQIKKKHCFVYVTGVCSASERSNASATIPFLLTFKNRSQTHNSTIQ